MSILNSVQIQAMQAITDAMLDDWSKTCKIWYPPILEDCTECLNPVDTTYINSVGLHGGPIANLCPFCGGTNKRQKEVTDTIQLEVDYTNLLNRQGYVIEAPAINRPIDTITVKGYLTELPKLQRSIEIQLNTGAFPHVNGRYVLLADGTEPFTIVAGRYFLASLKRVS
jgi:hypothetical protein